jgi:hypothetical protein
MSRRLKSFLIAVAMAILVTILSMRCANVPIKQYIITGICTIEHQCNDISGRLAITPDIVHLTVEGFTITLDIEREFKKGDIIVYHVKRDGIYNGILLVRKDMAYFELHVTNYKPLYTFYIFKV